MTPRKCPICGAEAPPRGEMCATHWILVPLSMKRKISSLYDPTRRAEEQSDRYVRAVSEATAAVQRSVDRLQVVPRIVAIEVARPWAFLLSTGRIPVLNRQTAPPAGLIGQRVAIVSSQKIDRDGAIAARDSLRLEIPTLAFDVRGVIAIATLDRLVLPAEVRPGDPLDPWFAGPFGWTFREIVAFPPVAQHAPGNAFGDLQCLPDAVARRAWYRRLVGLARADLTDPLPAGAPPVLALRQAGAHDDGRR